MARSVILRHTLPNGESHYDWLIERPDDEGGTLLSFRCVLMPTSLDSQSFDVTPMPDHRREYLDYEGLISGDRGEVVRVEMGTVDKLSESNDAVEVRMHDMDDPTRVTHVRGEPSGDGKWVFRHIQKDSS
jgi:hypothetical protein